MKHLHEILNLTGLWKMAAIKPQLQTKYDDFKGSIQLPNIWQICND